MTVGATILLSMRPPRVLTTLAPLLTASATTSLMYWGLCGSGRGVIATPPSQGRPILSLSTASQNLGTKASTTDSCTSSIFKAVHLWPLKLREPKTHSDTATVRSASAHTMAGFLASRPRHTRRRLGLGWIFWSSTAAFEVPMKAKISTFPVSMIGGRVVRPAPWMMFTTPAGKHLAKRSRVGIWHRQPVRGVLRTMVFPMSRAGKSTVYVSLKG
mmetsp:Transcript_10924/g.17882  ORF Transcript_10924/g.17882 Transcript_10924/m.17882 type:complete len:215 (-) Transcript_10924:114-758(-)